MKSLRHAAITSLALLTLTAIGQAEEKSVTWTGWFSEVDCAASRAARGDITPTNPECAKTCIEKGAAPVFLSEQAKAMFRISGYPSVIEDLGYHIEVQAKVDEAAKTMVIEKVKRLEYQGASCGRPTKSSQK